MRHSVATKQNREREQSPRSSLMDRGGWAPLPSWVFESNHLIDPVQNKILLFIAWKNLSRKDPDYRFSIRYLASRTGLTRSTVHRYVKMMRLAGLIMEKGRGKRGELLLDIPSENPFVPPVLDTELADSGNFGGECPGNPGQGLSPYPGQVQHTNHKDIFTANQRDISFLQSLKGKLSETSLALMYTDSDYKKGEWIFTERVPVYLRNTVIRYYQEFGSS